MEPTIIYEDQELLVINKPPGMVVNRSDTARGEVTLQDWVLSRFQDLFPVIPSATEGSPANAGGTATRAETLRQAQGDIVVSDSSTKLGMTENTSLGEEEFVSRSGIVHRLDKDTSGVLIIAKDAGTFQKLKTQFKERLVKKSYLALVHGRLREKAGEINAPIGRNPKNRFRFTVLEGGREAVTEYQVVSFYTLGAGPYTLLRLMPKTGRTHQLRVHLVHLGHPIISDPLYSGRKQLKSDLQLSPRIFLHAQSIGFRQPVTGAWLQVEAELPDDLKQVLARLQPIPLL